MTFTICDDQETQIERFRRLILDQYPEAEIIACRRAEEAVGCAAESQIMLLDIDTGTDMDGMAAARAIYGKNAEEGRLYSLPLIIFVTGFPERMREAFGVHAFYFLEKPVKREVLLPVLREAVSVAERIFAENQEKPSPENTLMIRNVEQTVLIPFREILYAESEGRLQRIHISKRYRSREEEVIWQGSMDELERQLPPDFYRIHRGFLVNMAYIVGYGKTGVELTDGSRLLISRYKYKEFVRSYVHYVGYEEERK